MQKLSERQKQILLEFANSTHNYYSAEYVLFWNERQVEGDYTVFNQFFEEVKYVAGITRGRPISNDELKILRLATLKLLKEYET